MIFNYVSFFADSSETPVVEKEVEDVDAPKVVDEENVVVENGKSEETDAAATAAAESVPENGQSEAEPEVSSTPAEDDAVEDVKNGDSTGTC